MRSPTLLLIRMNAAETSASSAIADWTLLTVVSRSAATAVIDTFMIEVSTTRTNIAIASRSGSRLLAVPASGTLVFAPSVIGAAHVPDTVMFSAARHRTASRHPRSPGIRSHRGPS